MMILLFDQRWDESDIQEETEDGRTVKSTIRVPMQVSDSAFYVMHSAHVISSSG